jgi:hypothetical protein
LGLPAFSAPPFFSEARKEILSSYAIEASHVGIASTFFPVGAQDIEDEEADVDGGGDFDDQHPASSTMVR